MKTAWQLQTAKNRLSEVVEKALRQGPQTITRRGKETVVILSVKDYEKLTKPKGGLVDFFLRSPLRGVDIDLERDKGFPREVDL
ncbi:MAG: type II toxin-antitoxin system Phd/YefM family antitoxin [Deltaproteobacteria bacterium]|nr:type II toxin-antitoxin system Phd/YefM family antitoxin [Deltaproteobacteria bacterium]